MISLNIKLYYFNIIIYIVYYIAVLCIVILSSYRAHRTSFQVHLPSLNAVCIIIIPQEVEVCSQIFAAFQ